MHRFLFRALLLMAALVVGLTGAVNAQSPLGEINGKVVDTTGATIPGATVTIENVATGQVRSATTGEEGLFTVTNLPPGNYKVKVEASGFGAKSFTDVVVNVGSRTALTATLEAGGITDVVEVTTESTPQINPSDNVVSGIITVKQINTLPLNGRNFLDLAALEPGVATVDGANFDPTKANYRGIAFGAQTGRGAQITVDGASVVDNVVGTTTQNFSQDAIQEFQVATSNFDIATGASGSGSVNVVTKSGTNEFHGSAFFFLRDNEISALPSLAPTIVGGAKVDPQFDRQQYGGTFGGPILKDRAFFFLSYEGTNQDDAALINTGNVRFRALDGFANTFFDQNLFTSRADFKIDSKNSLNLRYSHEDNNGVGPFGTPGSQPANYQAPFNIANQYAVSLNTLLTPRIVNNFRASYQFFKNVIGAPGLGTGLEATLGEIRVRQTQFRTGINRIVPQATLQRRYQLSDDVNVSFSKHNVRFGFNYERTNIDGLFAFFQPFLLTLYGPDESIAAGRLPANFTVNSFNDVLQLPVQVGSIGAGDPSLPIFTPGNRTINDRIQFYGNDTWKVSKKLTLNFGLAYRYDNNLANHDLPKSKALSKLLMGNLSATRKDKNNVSPRFGFAYDLQGDGKTVIRGGYQIAYDTIIDNLRLFERSDLGPAGIGYLGFGSLQTGIRFLDINKAPTLAQALPLVAAARQRILAQIAQLQSNLDPNVTNIDANGFGSILDSDLRIPYTQFYQIGFQRQLAGNMVLSVDFNYRFTVGELFSYDANRSQDMRTGPIDPNLADVTLNTSSGISKYKALFIKLDKRFSNKYLFTASYALSRLEGITSDSSGIGGDDAVNLDNLFEAFGPVGGDRTHRFVFSGTVEAPYGIEVGLISTIQGGPPFNALVGNNDFNGDGTFGDILPGLKFGQLNRGMGRGELQQLIDAFNSQFAGKTDPQGQVIPRILALNDPARTRRTGRLPRFGDSLISQDVRVSRTFKFGPDGRVQVTPIMEVFNLFNIANYAGFSQDITSPDFGQPSTRVNSVFGTGGPRA
ncbi:MAG: carboxypeptidase regulatory-like domain-containing protein, partial [Acidobacteriota bacterium]